MLVHNLHGENDNDFNVGTAYRSQLEHCWNDTNPVWKSVWSLPIPHRRRLFLWLSIKQKLMKNGELARRGMSSNSSCPFCKFRKESILEVLRDCPSVKNFWRSIISAAASASFFYSDLVHWLIHNLAIKKTFQGFEVPWSPFFASILWQLWKHRNNESFNGDSQPLEVAFQYAYSRARCFESRPPKFHAVSSTAQRISTWTRPTEGWFFLNCDRSVKGPIGLGFAGGVLRDSDGHWINGFSKNTDNAQAARLIGSNDDANNPITLVRAIASLRYRRWPVAEPRLGQGGHVPTMKSEVFSQTCVRWIPRSANSVDDSLTKMAPPGFSDIVFFDAAPAGVDLQVDHEAHLPLLA
ncbi:hypothetical protein F3Y22_tig00110234pilonHSYRG00097 [Hibiscus syriacus]|uniref:Reverse transcriptase zinc-binding domain-containing protein n=1 Tax=Hibiscus syriacus TaxID=106335 RepID=A0A6A3B908_HIBSY|nr:hypothetical protein F3Y22_tig00110234pilonHSYRG00097 [Hibiscus syriacus]